MLSDCRVVLVLSGGNALGAFQGGVYQALAERGVEIDWVVGASSGAINGAIICGNPIEARIMRLREFWRASERQAPESAASAGPGETARRTISAQATLATGQPHIFVPRQLPGTWWRLSEESELPSLYDTTPLAATLSRLVDFEMLNAGAIRFSATAVDLETGKDVVFDTRKGAIGPEHMRASSALVPVFSPVEIEGRLLADAGLSANLPLDVLLAEPPAGRTLCLAVNLLPLQGPRPITLGSTVERMQDLIFAKQSDRALEGWQRYYDLRTTTGGNDGGETAQPLVTLVHLAYDRQQPEVAGKMFDYSQDSATYRWDQGYRVASETLNRIHGGQIAIGGPGLSVHRLVNLEQV